LPPLQIVKVPIHCLVLTVCKCQSL
jgi:hypothetical protein